MYHPLRACAVVLSFCILQACTKTIDVQSNEKKIEAKISTSAVLDSHYLNKSDILVKANELKVGLLATKSSPKTTVKRSVQGDNAIAISIDNERNQLYIVNYSDGGFSILTADDRLPLPIGFSDSASVNQNDLPENFKHMLTVAANRVKEFQIEAQQYQDSIDQAYLSSVGKTVSRAALPPASEIYVNPYIPGTIVEPLYADPRIDPIMASMWDQGVGFNENCPSRGCSTPSNGKAWVGCVALAIGQVIYHHKHSPNQSYDWTLMHNVNGTAESSRLLRSIGNTVGMDYGCDGSGANSRNTSSSLNFFGYDCSRMTMNSTTDYASAITMIKSNLQNNWPVILAGSKYNDFYFFRLPGDGHQWVCDGYFKMKGKYKKRVCRPVGPHGADGSCFDAIIDIDKDYLHMNWGWGGYLDGWYMFYYLNPGSVINEGSGVSNAAHTYNFGNELYYNIKPSI